MMDVFAELERSMIQERVRAGPARVRSEGKQLGRLALEKRILDALKAPERTEGVLQDCGSLRSRSEHSTAY